MNTTQKRILLFIFFCIGTRLFFVYLSKKYTHYLPIMGVLALLPAAGLLYYYFSGKRKTGPEVFGDKIWWNKLRPIHATLYILFAISAIMKKEYAWIFLFIDVIFGLSAFIIQKINIIRLQM